MQYRIGLDIGIASVGYAVLACDEQGEPYRIVRIGSRVFDKLENAKDGKSLALPRREARGMRRRLRRRAHRLERARACFAQYLSVDSIVPCDVHYLRYHALDHLITNEQLASVLYTIIKRRGFKSNRKADNKGKEAGKLLNSTSANMQYRIDNGYRTVGEMFYLDSKYTSQATASSGKSITLHKVRNKADSYDHCILRSELADEILQILSAQQGLGNSAITQPFVDKILVIFNSQRGFDEGPGYPSPYSGTFAVGDCTFLPQYKRAPKASYTAEFSKCLQTLNGIKINQAGGTRTLTPDERTMLIGHITTKGNVKYSQLRNYLSLAEDETFNMVNYSTKKRDTALSAESKTAFSMANSMSIRKCLSLDHASDIQLLDSIAELLSYNKSDDKIVAEVASNAQLSCLDTTEVSALQDLSFAKFGHLSIEALRMIEPYLLEGATYDKACAMAGFDHRAHSNTDKLYKLKGQEITDIINDIGVPVVKRAVSQTIKVLNAIIQQYGSPVAVNVELARELAKSYSERQKIDRAGKERFADNERIKAELSSTLGLVSVKAFDIVKYRLYQEQGGKCAYSQQSIDVSRLLEAGYVEVDHILPYSRCNIDSYNNKVLVLASANQAKLNRTPYEFMGTDPVRWQKFVDFVLATYKGNTVKQKYLLMTELDEQKEQDFKSSNLNDTKYISRFMYNLIGDYLLFADSKLKRKVLAVNGAATSYMRKAWGIQKVRADGDTHHAIDAAVVACATHGTVNHISRFNKRLETYYTSKDESGNTVYIHKYTGEVLADLELIALTAEPYYGFATELSVHLAACPSDHAEVLLQLGYTPQEVMAIKPIFVSRMADHTVRGQIHAETIRSAKHIDEGIVVTKQPITNLKLDADGEIAGYYNKQSDLLLYDALRAQLVLHGGKGDVAFAQPFFKPKSDGTPGNRVHTVKVTTKASVGMQLPRTTAYADNGAMVRVDVFTKSGKNYLVPIYTKDAYSGVLPNRAITRGKSYEQWQDMDANYQFQFSLYSKDLIYIKANKPFKMTKTDGSGATVQVEEGYMYYVGTDSSTNSLSAHNHDNSFSCRGMGIQSLPLFAKCTVDVMGNITMVGRETRQPINASRR